MRRKWKRGEMRKEKKERKAKKGKNKAKGRENVERKKKIRCRRLCSSFLERERLPSL